MRYKLILLFLILIIFLFNFSHLIPYRIEIRNIIKEHLPPKIYSIISVLTSPELATKRLNNDYNTHFLPFTQQQDFKFERKKLNFIQDNISGYNVKKKSKTFYLDKFKNKLLVVSKEGSFFSSKIKAISDLKFKSISSNLTNFIILDIFVKNETIYVSGFFNNVDCKKLYLYNSEIKESFFFNKIFEAKECASLIQSGKIQSYKENNNEYILIATAADILIDRTTEKDSKPQSDESIYGKILKIDLSNNDYNIFTKGHRNILGLYSDEKVILSTENGPRGGDEINKIQSGKNYGWDISSFGTKYGSREIYETHEVNGFQEPIYTFIPSIGISEIIKLNGKNFNRNWDDNFLIASLNFNHILRVKFDKNFNSVMFVENIYLGSRIRDILFINEIDSIFLSSEKGELLSLSPQKYIIN